MYSLVKKTKNCQICKRSFANGKALGGHMRSHNLKLSVPNSLQTSNQLREDLSPRDLMRSEVIVGPKPEEEQITEKIKICKDLEKVTTHESQDSLTDLQTALLLVEMSKRKWPEDCLIPIDLLVSTREIDSEDDHHEYVDEEEDQDVKIITSDVGNLTEDNHEEDDGDNDTYQRKCKKRSRECTCDICGKVLRSYQALGGHRTSHTRKRLKICDKNDHGAAKTGNELRVNRRYKCEICSRVFESGQALGGHRKVHYTFLKPTN